MRALLLLLALAPVVHAQEGLAERIVALRAKVSERSASVNERYELASALHRAGRSDLALELALELTREPNFAPWAHYLVGQMRFRDDPTAAREAFARARDSARALGEPGTELARQASQAVAESESEERRGRQRVAAERKISVGLWLAALAWMACLGGGLYLTRQRPRVASRA
ncbi:MAG: hypothetical protein IPN34_03555 [Planctomycetes bacterium]|nr:hypothetical protein [Planctomycetota bacterium]